MDDRTEGEGLDIPALLRDAAAAYVAMSPVDRALHDTDQRRNFLRGMAGRDPGPDVLAEEVRRLRAALAEEREYVRSLQAALGIKAD